MVNRNKVVSMRIIWFKNSFRSIELLLVFTKIIKFRHPDIRIAINTISIKMKTGRLTPNGSKSSLMKMKKNGMR